MGGRAGGRAGGAEPPAPPLQVAPRAEAPAQPSSGPTNGGSGGWAYQGAPRPANETERLGLLRALGVLDSEQGPDQFDAITRLLCAVFNVPIALVSLVDAGAAAAGAAPAWYPRAAWLFWLLDARRWARRPVQLNSRI